MTFGECTRLTTPALSCISGLPVAAIADCGSTETAGNPSGCGFLGGVSTGTGRNCRLVTAPSTALHAPRKLQRIEPRVVQIGFDGFGGAAKLNVEVISPTVASRQAVRLETDADRARMSFSVDV